MHRMISQPRDPLAATERLLVDGSNLLHALTRGRGPAAAPPATVIGRLRGVVPPSVAIDLVFDGPAERGLRGERIAAGLTVRYSGPRTGDAVILSLVDEISQAGGPSASAAVLVVTDDRDLRHRLRLRGARTAGCAWLMGRLDAPGRRSSPSVGNARPPHQAMASAGTTKDGDDDGRRGWQTGRGATTKRGNPQKARKGSTRSSDRSAP
jgi:YacP-like NYN domain